MVLTKAQAKSLDILEVARSLGMEMKRKSHREYYWAEHDSFKIDTVKNTWHWYSQNIFGDTINLVQQIRNVSYKEAMVFLETGSFPEAKPVEEDRKPFNYTLAPYEQPFVEARTYLKEIRGLSDDTIDFFLEKGVLAQAKRKDKDGVIEDVLVFKYLDRNQQLVGASLQGLVPDQERHPGKGYLKQIMYQSEAISGLNVSIGSPERLIVTEAPIDLMSYYELHKGELNDVRLVAMEGLKEGVLSHYVLEILQERGELAMDERDYTKPSELTRTSRFLSVAAETSTLFQDHKYDDLITLAVDRDKAGTDFITKLREKKIPVIDARPPQREGKEKTDWNDALRTQNQQSLVDSSAVSVENEKSFNNPLELVWELHRKWEDELAEKIREDLGINYELQAWQFEKEMSRFITTDLDKLFAKRTRLERDAYFADSTTSIRKEIDRLDAQILEYIEKAPEKSQELDMIFEQQKNERTSGSLGSLQPEAEGSPTPVPKAGTFERSVTSRPTTSSHLLYFTINEEFQSSNDGYYHSISLDELTKLNRPIRRLALQNAAQYYLDELANSKIYYVTPDKTVQVHFEEKHFMHLTGIKPIALGQTPEKTLHDFAEGNGHFDNILLANNDAAFDKLKVLSDLSVATESTSFYFDDLTDLRRYDGRFDSLIKSDDKDIILLFKELEEENYIPISVFKSRTKLTKELETVDKTPILGVFRERDGRIEQLSINEDYVKDRGNELQTILKDGLFEEIKLEEQVHNKQELKRDADADGISDEEELLQGTNPYDFRLKPGSKPEVEESLQADEVVLAAASLAVADFIQNKDMAGLSRHLKEGIKEFLDSDKYKDYLTKMSHLNNYSNRNLRLILSQNPEAKQVASFKQWKENFGRHVKKGEKAFNVIKLRNSNTILYLGFFFM